MISHHRSAKALLCLGLCLACESYANVFDTYGQGAASIALGNAAIAGGPSSYAAYSNPAALTTANRSEISTSLIHTQFHLQDLPDAPGGQLPPRDADESQVAPIEGVSLGLNLKLHELVRGGLAVYMPQGNFGKIHGLSPYESSYLRFSEQQEKPAIFTALAVKLPADIAVGFGAYYSLRAKGILQLSLSSSESEGRFDLMMEPVVVPYFGLLWAPDHAAFKLAMSYRAAQETQSEISSAFALVTPDALLPFDASTSLVPFYDPALLRAGASFEIAQITAHLSAEQVFWSNYRSPLVTLTGSDIAALSEELQRSKSGLQDTRAYRLGMSAPLLLASDQKIEWRAGVEYHTSANRINVRSQVVDPARLTLAAGGSWSLNTDDAGHRMSLEAAAQYHRLEALTTLSAKGSQLQFRTGSSLQTFVGGLSYVL